MREREAEGEREKKTKKGDRERNSSQICFLNFLKYQFISIFVVCNAKRGANSTHILLRCYMSSIHLNLT